MSVDEEPQILPEKGTGPAELALEDPDSLDGLLDPSGALLGA